MELPIQPLEVLVEESEATRLDLPPLLEQLYGGPFGLRERLVYANFVSMLDGVVAVPSLTQSNKLISGGNDADRLVMGLLRAVADVILIGAGTLHGSPRGSWTPERAFAPSAGAFAELRRRLGLSAAPELAILSGSGSLSPTHPALESGARPVPSP